MSEQKLQCIERAFRRLLEGSLSMCRLRASANIPPPYSSHRLANRHHLLQDPDPGAQDSRLRPPQILSARSVQIAA